MMGYAKFDQVSAGLHTRLAARAFVFASPTSGRRVVFVSAELAMLFSSVKQGVLKKLASLYGGQYNDTNVMIAATHTHSGPGGFSHHALYNLTTSGHIAQNYNAIVDGITEAIVQAHQRLATATVSMMAGAVAESTMVNRSRAAFLLNPEALTVPPASDVNKEMTILRIQSGAKAIGAIAWHGVHNTSMSQDNRLISADHMGYAASLFEEQFGTVAPFRNAGAFVAAFPTGPEGDMSPNLTMTDPKKFTGPGANEIQSTYLIGRREFDAAISLFNVQGHTGISDSIDYRHTFVTMPAYVVQNTSHTNGVGQKFLCSAAMGASFAAGAEDGPANMGAWEGMAIASAWNQLAWDATRATLVAAGGLILGPLLGPVLAPTLALALQGADDPCQRPKPVLLPTGALGWTPAILPFQLLRLGPLVIAGIPGEMTMQAARRLKGTLMTALAPIGIRQVILTGLANEYSGYITTPEEYGLQHYEGASTIFGRLTFDAYQEIFLRLATAMATGQSVPGGQAPPDLGVGQIELQAGVDRDEVPAGEAFGQFLVEPPATVARGTRVHAIYRSGHPKNDLRRNDTYLRIERDQGGGNWTLEAWDAMPQTMLFWARSTAAIQGTSRTSPACPNSSHCYWSSMGVYWDVPASAAPGRYRIRVFGSWKNGVTNSVVPYIGTSRDFIVQ